MGNQESKSASTISEVGTTDDKKFTVKKGDSERHEEMKDETAIGISPAKFKKVFAIEGQNKTHEEKWNTSEHAVNEARKAFLEGNRLFRESRFDVAKSQYSRALNTLQELLSDDDIEVYCKDYCLVSSDDIEHHKATALSNIGLIEFAEGRYNEAKALLTEAVAMRKKDGHKKRIKEGGGEGTSPSINLMDGLESLSIELSQDHMMFWKSPTMEQKRLAATLKEHGSVDVVTADSLNNLAACLEVLGRLDEAKPLYEESLNLRKIVYGEHSLKAAESMQNLATILDSQGHLREAEDMLIESLSIYEAILGKESPEAAVTMNNLGVLLCHLGRMDRALELLDQTVKTRQRVYGENHHFTVCAKQNLDYVVNKKKSMEEKSKRDRERSSGERVKPDDALGKMEGGGVEVETAGAPSIS